MNYICVHLYIKIKFSKEQIIRVAGYENSHMKSHKVVMLGHLVSNSCRQAENRDDRQQCSAVQEAPALGPSKEVGIPAWVPVSGAVSCKSLNI